MPNSTSERILVTPSAYTKKHYLYAQEIGTLTSSHPHLSQREQLDSYLFFIVTEGSGTVTIQGEAFPVKAGDCVWLNCLTPYSHKSNLHDPWTLKWVHFNGFQLPSFYQLYIEKGGLPVYTPLSLTAYTELLQTIYRLHQTPEALTDLLSHKHLTDLITLIFADAFHKDTATAIPQKFLDIREYIETNYTDKLTLDLLAEQFFISKYHLHREYQKLFGTTITNAISIKRLSHAKSLLRFSGESIESIALTCGFQTASYFIKVFKKYEGLTPLEYRRKW
ncbi:MAG: helix-turn-helix domain-containing protein [Lachnospiraceae bacterium]|nr:helix-turn-helix domain-containing protein [Lachnospiraceae bacterium]MBQ7782203.1 helix-turn-helix domain-containing protein [Lachnospiraceae bacterium]